MADIFISYATVDRPFARRLADALEARGWSVWSDHCNLRGGQHFDRMIDGIMTGTLLLAISREILERLRGGRPITRVHVGVAADAELAYAFE